MTSPSYRIAVIPGDGIGKDVTAEAVRVLETVNGLFGSKMTLEHLPWGADYFLETGITVHRAFGYTRAYVVSVAASPRGPAGRRRTRRRRARTGRRRT